MKHYSCESFGSLIQNQHSEKIFIIQWEESKQETVLPPQFYFFDELENVIEYITTQFVAPFKIVTEDDFIDCLIHVPGGYNSALFCDDEFKTMRFYHYKDDYIASNRNLALQCYRDDIYIKLKDKLSEDSIQDL